MNSDIRINTPLLDSKNPPICLHILGQGLVSAIWEEGQDLKKDLDVADKQFITMKQERDALWHKCKKLEEHVADLNEKINLLNDLNNI